MVSATSSFSGLSSANIATLFGQAALSSDTTVKDGATTSAGATSSTAITGAGGTNAAKAIQAIVTQIQIEKTQTSTQGKVSTLSLASVSVSSTYEKTVNLGSGTISVGVTALNSVATATGDTTADAVGALMAQVKAQESQVMSANGGDLYTKAEADFGGRSGSSSFNWTANSVTVNMNETANQGLELSDEEDSLNDVSYLTRSAQQFQAPSVASTPAASAPTTASFGDASNSPSSASANGSALYLEVDGPSFGALAGQETQLVSNFLSGALPGQNGTAPQNGDGFDYTWSTAGTGDDDGSSYSIKAVMISNYDPAAVESTAAVFGGQSGQSAWMNADEQTVAMGGTVVGAGGLVDIGMAAGVMAMVIPLKTS